MKQILKALFKKLGFQISKYTPEIEKAHQKKSFSQCGEDLIVQYIFNLRGITKPTYLDIGANHPFNISNTALLYQNGSRGINIEANPHLFDSFIKYRPEDINLNVGVGTNEDDLDLFIMQDHTLSTFSEEECNQLQEFGKQLKEIKRIKVLPIYTILNEYSNNNTPDFLSLDVEGLDLAILKSIDFQKLSPKIICVEAAEYSPIGAGERKNELIDFLVSKNYYEYANTNLNAIMVRRDFWFINE